MLLAVESVLPRFQCACLFGYEDDQSLRLVSRALSLLSTLCVRANESKGKICSLNDVRNKIQTSGSGAARGDLNISRRNLTCLSRFPLYKTGLVRASTSSISHPITLPSDHNGYDKSGI